MSEYKDSPHGGDIYRNKVRLDFSVSLNPLGMPEEVTEALREDVPSWSAYPDPYCKKLKEALSLRLGVSEDFILFGNGADELIFSLVTTLHPKKALLYTPSFSEYEAALKAAGCEITYFMTSFDNSFYLDANAFAAAVSNDTDIVFLCNPSNPTGQGFSAGEVQGIEKACLERQALLCVDECFLGLCEDLFDCTLINDCNKNKNLVILRAFTKTYAMAGLRLGYMVTSDEELLFKIEKNRQPWAVSSPAQTAGLAALLKTPDSYLYKARGLIGKEREYVFGELKKCGYMVIPSKACFLLFYDSREKNYAQNTDDSYPGLYAACLKEGILIRDCRNFRGLKPGFYRIGLHGHEENQELLAILRRLF